MNLSEIVRSVELPKDIWWLEDNDILGRGLREPGICAFVAYLYADGPSEGRIYVHPIMFGITRGGIREKVKNHIAIFQVAIKKGTAMHVGQGENLDWRGKL